MGSEVADLPKWSLATKKPANSALHPHVLKIVFPLHFHGFFFIKEERKTKTKQEIYSVFMMSCQPRKLRAFSKEKKETKQEIINQRNVRMSCITQQIHKQTHTHTTPKSFF